MQVSKRGHDLIRDPRLNKGSAFGKDERTQFGLQGLLPPNVNTLEQQAERAFAGVVSLDEPLAQYGALAALHDRNETLFYHVLCDNIERLMPIVYTPTVGLATQNFSRVFQRGRGVWITPDCRGQIESILRQVATERPVRMIVATDNEAILGIGDQGAGGMAISVGKLALYVAGAGIRPEETLPVSLDVGTNNQALLDDDLYLGWRENRLTGADYDTLVAEFVEAVQTVFPGALLQWEDFRKDNALTILDRYRDSILSFNDDIQGTGAVALAGVLTGLKATGEGLGEQRILIHGAGAAGLGIARQIRAALREEGISEDDARHRIGVLDSGGLLVLDRDRMDSYKKELAWDVERAEVFGDDRSLANVVAQYHPTVLIGSSGQAGAFNEEIVTSMAAHAKRPIVLPFSNPTDHAEARPEDLYRWTDGRVQVATGSPFAPVSHGGREYEVGQGNNVFIFPGLGLGALAAGCRMVTDGMVSAAASALADSVTDTERERGLLFPSVTRLRDVSLRVAQATAEAAARDNVATRDPSFVMWDAEYETYEPVDGS